MCEKCEEIHNEIISLVDEAREFMAEMIISKCEHIETLMKASLEKLAIKINDYPEGSPEKTIITSRFKGEDPLNRLVDIIPALWDEEFSYEDYKDIGHNDGILSMAITLLNKFGDEENAKKASNLMYND